MPAIRYKPRLKKGVFKSQKIVETIKKSAAFKKLKWRYFCLVLSKKSTFRRCDVLVIYPSIIDQRKSYKLRVTNRQKFFAYFSSVKGRALNFYLSSTRKDSFRALNLFYSLGRRLDLILVGLNFSKTKFQARWLISRGFLSINGKKLPCPSYQVRGGDFIEMALLERLFKRDLILSKKSYIFSNVFTEVCYDTFSFLVLQLPEFSEMNFVVLPHTFDFEKLSRRI
jgi:ribosomal protein S4